MNTDGISALRAEAIVGSLRTPIAENDPLRSFSLFLLCQRKLHSMLAIGCKYTMKVVEVNAWFWDQGDQPGDVMTQTFQFLPFMGSGSDTCMQ